MTNSEHNDLEKLLKDSLSDKTAIVPDFVWDKIEEEIYPKKKKRGFFWLFFIGIGLTGGLSAAYFLTGSNNHRSNAKTQYARAGQTENSESAEKQQIGTTKAVSGKEKTVVEKNSGGNEVNVASQINKGTGQTKSSASGSAGRKFSQKSKSGAEISKSGKTPESLGVDPVATVSDPVIGRIENEKGSNDSGNESHKDPENNVPPGNENAATDPAAKADSTQTEKEAELAQKNEPKEDSTVLNPDEPQPEAKSKRFAIILNGGASLYDMAVFKDYFTSGQLSNRSFESSGFELGAGFSVQISRKFGVYTNIAFNQKSTSFEYNLAITESQYFDQLLQGEKIQLANIVDNGVGNCFLAKDVKASYQVNSLLLSLGTTYEALKLKKFTLGLDLRVSANLNSSVKINELTVLEIQPYAKERFNYLKTSFGLNLGYQLNERFFVGIAPMYYLQFNKDKQSFYKGLGKELVLPVRFGFCF